MSDGNKKADPWDQLDIELAKLRDLFDVMVATQQEIQLNYTAAVVFGQVAAVLNAYSACSRDAESVLDQLVQLNGQDLIASSWPQILGLDCSDIPEG